MVEAQILIAIEEGLRKLTEDPHNNKSAPLFKKVIANNVPIWKAVEQVPAVCFYLADTTYQDHDGLRYNGNARLIMYIYNKHKARGLSLSDILTPYIDAIRAEVTNLSNVESSILNAFVSKISRDSGTVLPYTIAELVIDIDFVETKVCN